MATSKTYQLHHETQSPPSQRNGGFWGGIGAGRKTGEGVGLHFPGTIIQSTAHNQTYVSQLLGKFSASFYNLIVCFFLQKLE